MKKGFVLFVLLSVFCVNAFSQNVRKLNEKEQTAFEQNMLEQSKKIQTLQCNFLQEKTSTLVTQKAVSKGIMLYQSSSMLRWEYTEPIVSTLILNGKNAILLDKNGNSQGNANVLNQLGSIIISMINGEGLRQSKQFSVEVFVSDTHFLIVLTPIQKRLKEFYKSIEVKIDKDSYLASEILMNEKSGDKMLVSLTNKKLNEKIDANKFVIK